MQNQSKLLEKYSSYMSLKIFVDGDNELKQKYISAAENHNKKILDPNNEYIDAGFDLYAPAQYDEKDVSNYKNVIKCFGKGWKDVEPVNKINFKVKCSAEMHTDSNKIYNTGYYMYPRSSLSKTKLRLANSVGIIDAGYRGYIIGMFDVVNIDDDELSDDREADYIVEKYDRLVQICSPFLTPIVVEIVDRIEKLGVKTSRDEGGFGSTGR